MAANNDVDGQIQRLTGRTQGLKIADMKSKNVELSPLEKQNILLNHIILPHFLPQTDSPHFHQSELKLLDEIIENVMDLSEFIPPKTVALFKSMHKTHHNLTAENISKEINTLQPGDTFAMFVRRQNCTFMVYVPPDEHLADGKPQNAIVATFPGRLHPNEVYNCDSDIEFNYPQLAIKVKFSQMLRSEDFAHQLCFMYHNLPIESKKRDYVSRWLMAVMSDEHSETVNSDEFPVITKKFRDELLGDSTKHYFRRSSFYTIVKVLLQHSLTVQMGIVFGEMMYKCVMLKFLIRICDFYKSQRTFDIDLLSQMIAKMARRIEKLKFLFEEALEPKLVEMFNGVVQEAIDLIAVIRTKIDQRINESVALKVELPPLSHLNFDKDIKQKMPKLSDYLIQREKAVPQKNNPKFKVKSYERFGVKKSNPNGAELGIRVHWMAFENEMLNGKTLNDDCWSPEELRQLSVAYSRHAEAVYKGNRLFGSRMILVRLKIISLLDQYACKEYPLLLDHDSGINPNIIASLLLPHQKDMKMARELEQYFSQRNQNATDPSLIGQIRISYRSFSTKFAEQNSDMRCIRDQILQADSDNLVKKQTEWIAGRRRVENLRSESSKQICEYFFDRFGKRCHAKNCEKCALEREANNIKVEQYEHLLPVDRAKQFAIVFELNIPEMIAHLRDTLFDFAKFCNSQCDEVDIEFEWISNRPDISRHSRSTGILATVRLGNTAKRSVVKLHVDNAFDSFEIENKRNCIFYVKMKKKVWREIPTTIADDAIKKMCTFRAQNEYYDCLQWTLTSTNHFQNEVLAEQSKCPNNLSLSEFKNFGSLRADGHRLQLRKLYAMIETEALSFENQSVLMLIMQTLWECGVSGDADDDIHESHIDFGDPIFCHEMIQLLKKFVGQQKSNWKHPFKMIMAVLIAVRAFEINADALVADEIVEFLNSVRFVVCDWIAKISSAIREMENPDEIIERELRMKLIYVGIAGALTFYVHPKHKHFKRIFNVSDDGTAPHLWLQYIITVKNNTLMYTNDEASLPSNLRMFLRLIESIGVYLEPSIRTMIQQKPTLINNLIRKLWPRADGTSFSSLKFHSEKYPQIFVAETMLSMQKRTITIDIIAGIFLVDNFPVGRLPSEIVKNSVYRRFFGDVTFEVQPDAPNNYTTLQRYNDCTYRLQKVGKNVIVTEQMADGVEKELIDHSIFSGDFPHLLVEEYSQWLNKSTNCIEFRKRTFGRMHFSKETSIDYELNLETKLLVHMKTRRPMLDINAPSYKNISHHLARLEHSNYIHILMDTPEVAKVELVRMNLKFTVNAAKGKQHHYKLESNEFGGMQVSHQQNIGTLHGLNHGLILESDDDAENRILLIPHGNIHSKRTESHVTVHIDTEKKLRNPPFFQYKIDGFCRQIKSNNRDHTSWFYLAYLHAVTSHGQIETFTGLSGTERAIQILQSAFAWSSAPYKAEAIKMLEQIAELTPCRRMDGNRQIVTWPEHIQSHAAQDCYVFIAKKLFEDSQRLHGLYFKKTADVFKEIKTNLELNARDHRRCQPLNPNLYVANEFIEHKHLITSPPEQNTILLSKNTQAIAALYHRQEYKVPQSLDLRLFLLSDTKLIGITADDNDDAEFILNILNHSVYDNIANLWLRLYETARKKQFNSEQFALILSVYAHRGVSMDLLLPLQVVALAPDLFQHIFPPFVKEYDITIGNNPDEGIIYGALIKCYKKPSEYYTEWAINGQQASHDWQLQNIIYEVITLIKQSSWPCHSVDLIGRWNFPYIDFAEAQQAVNELLLTWINNCYLEMFIYNVEQRLRELPASGRQLNLPKIITSNTSPLNWSKFNIDVDNAIRENLNESIEICSRAKKIWRKKNKTSEYTTANDWWMKVERILDSGRTKHLIEAGLFLRMVPSLLLPKIVEQNIDERFKAVIGAWAMAIACEQWEKRIESYYGRPELEAARQQEIENEPYANWKPCKRPEWLLFEIEQNLTIRKIQVEVANRMINPPSMNDPYAKHSVMQLNMGEGKTAVIVPILAAVLADGTQTCQITVLKSLYATNLNSLRQYLGGMLNRRLYTFACRRDALIEQHIYQLLHIYEECMEKRGVILTLPEYRLSFQLKMYEAIQKQNIDMAQWILEILKWSNKNMRNILDESDAILQPKYQLVYTVGNQMPPDGDHLRWTVAQAVLKRVPRHMKQLYLQYGKDHIEFDDAFIEESPDEFTPCRILNETMFELLKIALIDDFLDGKLDIDFPDIVSSKKDALRKILTNKIVDESSFEVVDGFLLNEQNTIWILSGLLRFEVLKLILTKRWRVNYGVNANGHRKMAVPFKAKDVAAEMTEFGHPDVAICFTLLSYYYAGLTDAELLKIFSILENDQNAKVIYEEWIETIRASEPIDPTIQSYDGINLDDIEQRDNLLFPLLRFNMHVIDFYLSNVVFRHEMKIFENKLICTAWDLCSDHFEHLVTGFSGTNDTKDILPLPIAQNDLKKLENTNQQMREILLQPENQSYERLPANVSGMEILQRLIKCDIPVLLDAGALMLELDNEEVAEEWLNLASEDWFDAAVYFDSRDILQTIDRSGTVIAFDCSVYRENLHRCLVYLDDVHTRGTDLKFPLHWRASVTLCGDITRDKTVQSCMRMRQLGKTHSISFWASYEADTRIRKLCSLSAEDRVRNEHVIEFICNNSEQFEETNMVHWTANALNYTKKRTAHKLFEASDDANAMNDLYRMCVDNEFVVLRKMYGEKEEALITEVAHAQFAKLSLNSTTNDTIASFIDVIRSNVSDKLKRKAPQLKQFTHSLDEEQEKELEHEFEEQRSIERPPYAVSAKPHFDTRLNQLVRSGVDDATIKHMKCDDALMPIGESLSHTQLFRLAGISSAWADHILVTNDFKTVIVSLTPTCDKFLRPVWWIAQLKNANGNDLLVLLSSYECNQLLPAFRTSKMATLFMYRPRLSKVHSNFLRKRQLQVTAMDEPAYIDIEDEIQIAVYSGSMYFDNKAELNAYCGFLGLIPRPRTTELQTAFEQQIIQANGFVPMKNRQHSPAIYDCVGHCKFSKNPVDLALKLIEVNHQSSAKFSHAAHVLIRGIKPDEVWENESSSSSTSNLMIEENQLEEQLDEIDDIVNTAKATNCQIQ